MKPTPVKLPRKMSALITIALADLAKVERSKKYEVIMGTWHDPSRFGDRVCAVCLAGAVMAKTLGADPSLQIYPERFPENESALCALDELREGDALSAAIKLGLGVGAERKACRLSRHVAPYRDNPKKFRADMRKLARELKTVGL